MMWPIRYDSAARSVRNPSFNEGKTYFLTIILAMLPWRHTCTNQPYTQEIFYMLFTSTTDKLTYGT